MDVICIVICSFILIFGISFLLILRNRGIILYVPTKKSKGKVIDIITKHRVSREQRGSHHLMDINEDFAIVEFQDGNETCIAESMFPIAPFEVRIRDNVTIHFKENKKKVYIKKCE